MTKPYYITTPLYYVNSKPHIGHAYTNVLCDTFARFHRALGEEIFFMTGTDEHGTKIDKAAREAGLAPKTFVDTIVPEFKKLWQALQIKYDFFIRTTDDSHKQFVQKILKDLEIKGDIYSSKYKGWYCTPCESFWTELQLKERKCPDCHREVSELEEENYFFKMSKYQSWLIDYIKTHRDFIKPESRRNEVLGFLDLPLEDLCITRPKSRLEWGIPYPTSPEHVVYVWFDALVNYLSAESYPEVHKRFKKIWPADVHMIGKDILRQHAVYWPIMLKAIGTELPGTVVAHGWWTIEGAKVSKSRGNAVDPFEMVKKFSADGVRYYLLREVTLGLDGIYSEGLMTERFNTDLANDLGNLVMRSTAMLERYFGSKFPEASKLSGELQNLSKEVVARAESAMKNYDPRSALAEIWEIIRKANQYVDISKPWVLAKENKTEELKNAICTLLETIRTIAILLQPFLPASAKKILKCFGIEKEVLWKETTNWKTLKPGLQIQKSEALFPKFEVKS